MFTNRLLPILLLFGASATARAADFLVDTTSDSGAAAFTVCDADNANGNCSLRGAITAANVTPGSHNIVFDVPVSDAGYQVATAHWRFAAGSDLPIIERSVVIDGYTQPGAIPNSNAPTQGGSNARLAIEVRGPGAGASTGGFYVANGNAEVVLRGLAINNFASNILFSTVTAQRVEGCFIGTDITGSSGVATGSSGIGIRIRSGQATIGGNVPAARNVISGNAYIGIWAEAGDAAHVVQGNLIGTDAAGNAAIPGQDYGLFLSTLPLGAIIGGSDAAARNIISGNEFGGVYRTLSDFPALGVATRIEGNYFGTDISGTQALGNGTPPSGSARFPAIYAFGIGACGMRVGGTAPGTANLIANSGGAGVHIASCRNAPILGNTFRDNQRSAIDLSETSNADGATLNDAGDIDGSGNDAQVSAGNRLQNTVEVIEVVVDEINDQLRLRIRVDSLPSAAAYPLRLDIYREDELGAYPVTSENYVLSEAQQPRDIVLPLALTGTRLGVVVTDADGNSSELRSIGDLFKDGFETSP